MYFVFLFLSQEDLIFGIFGTLANAADPDQMSQNAAYDQGLQCLLKLQEVTG